MDSLLTPVELNRETSRMLDEIRSGADNALYGASPDDAEKKIQSCVLPLIEGAGLLNLQVVHYRWYLREMARLWRSRKGSDLAFHLEHCIRKWVSLGLEPRTLQFLACETYCRLKGKSEGRSANDECGTESADVRPGTEPSVESVKSVDVRSGTGQSAESAKSADSPRDPS